MTDIAWSACESFPYLLKKGCFLTPTLITRSPFTCPLPLNRNVAPLSIPLGNFIYYDDFIISIPYPLQCVQGWLILWPLPPHCWHYIRITIIPWWKVINPVPWQVWHFWVFVPGFAFEPLQTLQILRFLNSIV